MAWRQFILNLDTLDPGPVEDIFVRFGAHSITLTDSGDKPVLEPGPGETPLWAETTMTGLFSPQADFDKLGEALIAELNLKKLPLHRIEELEDRDWEREWLRDFKPMRFGRRLWIRPKHATAPEADTDGSVTVYLDPGLAFGTGTHATTALCLEWLDGLPLQGKSLLDYGCGSGILAIAGLKLGCVAAVAMDIDPQAVIATRQNASNNAVADKLRVVGAAVDIDAEFDVVVANILAGPLAQFAESITLTLRQGGMLALSGVLCEQADDVMAAFLPWIVFNTPTFRAQDGQIWSRLTGKRRVSAHANAPQ